MAYFEVKIDSIDGGIANYANKGASNQYSSSIAIDLDLPLSDVGTGEKTAGAIRPAYYAEFSGVALDGYPRWILTAPQDDLLYTYASNGEVISYSTLFGTETVVLTPTSGEGNGAAYYNNFLYFATPTDITRRGPLDGTDATTNNYWVTTLGLTALVDTTYPTDNGMEYPNHPMHVHVDNRLYFGDFDTTGVTAARRGKGLIHYIQTTYGTAEGTANDGSTFNALDLPYNYAPFDIESWGNDLVIAASPLSTVAASTTFIQGKAKLFFWDTVSDTFYRSIELPDPLVTALLYTNGILYIWSGNLQRGYRVSRYAGGDSVEQIAFFEEGGSPSAGAVDSLGNRIIWGGYTTYPENSRCVWALGSKKSQNFALHNIYNSSDTTNFTSGAFAVTAVKSAQHASFLTPRLVAGWKDAGTTVGLDRLSGTTGVAVWRSLKYHVDRPFRIAELIIPLGTTVGASMSLTPSILVNDEGTTTTLTAINNTNYAASQRYIKQVPNVYGKNNFELQLRWTQGILPVTFPIVIRGETMERAEF